MKLLTRIKSKLACPQISAVQYIYLQYLKKQPRSDHTENLFKMQCSNCSALYNSDLKKPFHLPCGHIFCQTCLKFIEKLFTDGLVNCKQCFTCKRTWTNVLVKNLPVANDFIPHASHPGQAGSSSNQKIAAQKVDQEPNVNMCAVHQQPFIYWCQSCGTLSCALCSNNYHKGCPLESLKDNVLPKLEKECSTAIQLMTQNYNNINKNISKTCQALEDTRMYKASLEKLEKDIEAYKSKIEALHEKMGEYITEMRKCIKDLTEGGNPLEIWQRKNQILSNYTDQIVLPSTSPPYPRALITDAYEVNYNWKFFLFCAYVISP